MTERPEQMSAGWWDPILWDARQGAPHPPRLALPSAMDDVTKPEVLLVGPKGETLISRGPRRIGFRPPILP